MPHTPLSDLGMRSRSWSIPCQPRNFLRPCLLLLLDEHPDYGYDLRERLSQFSQATWDAGTIYRVLNSMEDDGLASSSWEPSPNGPQRRRYEITGDGQAILADWCRGLDEVRDVLLNFLERYERDMGVRLTGSAARPDTRSA
ncbi:MAG: PadR family transcriptional regulator [Candidatus Dormibacteria bacterium]